MVNLAIMDSPTPASILKNTFGYDTFLPHQLEVIENILAHRDTLAVMPTGGGKSLCYQIPALLLPGLTVVVSPLIALMKDQVEQLHAAGVQAVVLNSTLSPQAYADNMERVRRGKVKLLYVAPETLLTPRIFSLLDSVQVDLLTIDEAHCISEWGHDFRPEYRQLVEVRRRYPRSVCLALTATATPRVRSDIIASLQFSQSNQFVASFNRPNLFIEVIPKNDPLQQTVRFLEGFKDQSGIIYCFSRKQVDELAADLRQKGFSVLPYHAGLEDDQRRRNQEAFIRDDVQIMVATIAFGMGINKPNVRFVLHYDLPKSIEGYYQEIGRAGRDGLPAHCLLLYGYGDAAKLHYFIDQKQGTERQVALQHLDAMMNYAEDQLHCRRIPLLAYFGEKDLPAKCDNCSNCTSVPPRLDDITVPAQKFLSCVVRTGEKFGAKHVAAVLRGDDSEQVKQWQHDQLSTFGIGADLTEKQWMLLARQLMQMGYLNRDNHYFTLSLTEKARTALKKRTKITGQFHEIQQQSATAPKKKTDLEINNGLFALLRQKRKELADETGVPPYVIFPDTTLVEMAAYFPQSMDRLMDISGVGKVKAQQYGKIFISLIRDFCQGKGIAEKQKEVRRNKSDTGRRYQVVGEAYQAGDSVATLMARYHVEAATIFDHLVRFVAAGNPLRAGSDLQSYTSVPANLQQAVFKAFQRNGTMYLKHIFEEFNGKIDYDNLKILRLIYLVNCR